MTNLYAQFRRLLPDSPLLIGTVIAESPLRIALPDGSLIAARGVASIGQSVFVRGGAIEGPAPALPVEVIEV